jgi:hypothetical protein
MVGIRRVLNTYLLSERNEDYTIPTFYVEVQTQLLCILEASNNTLTTLINGTPLYCLASYLDCIIKASALRIVVVVF